MNRIILIVIGVVIAILLPIVAFQYKTFDQMQKNQQTVEALCSQRMIAQVPQATPTEVATPSPVLRQVVVTPRVVVPVVTGVAK